MTSPLHPLEQQAAFVSFQATSTAISPWHMVAWLAEHQQVYHRWLQEGRGGLLISLHMSVKACVSGEDGYRVYPSWW